MSALPADTWPDTLRIARSIALTEAQVCQILARLQDERHASRQHGGAHA
ncbi:hypothetical protein [Methylorubrum thiocyanatum]